ncbi:MAG TPA: transglycosylase SLT domain-containing protein [Magnetospirillaceae bacterium]|jgi:hypothetical protein
MRVLGAVTVLGLGAVLMTATLSSALAADTPQSPVSLQDAKACGVETKRQEVLQAIPDRLLHAISLVESGRWDADRKASFAWPWTVTAEGEGHFLPSKEAAMAEVVRLKHKGVTNIDVGCMQVNLQAHPDAFATLDDALDPATNVSYGARFLNELRANTPNWETAAAYYHSQTPALAAAYKAKLVTAWKDARGRADDRGDNDFITAAMALENRPPIGMILPTPAQGGPTDVKAQVMARAAQNQVETDAQKAAHLAQTEAEKAEAKRIADAYRAARLEEYHRHKLQMAAAHS